MILRDAQGRFAEQILIDRFLANIDPGTSRLADGSFDPAVCWIWIGCRKQRRSGPVGWFRYEDKMHPAPRVALAIKTGELREHDQACHSRICRSGALCTNWNHLYWGSVGDNIADHVALYGRWGRNKTDGKTPTETCGAAGAARTDRSSD